MFETLNEKIMVEIYGPFNPSEIDKVDYCLTPISKDTEYVGTVKLGAKCTLKNGEKYGNIIQIPFDTLNELVQHCKERV